VNGVSAFERSGACVYSDKTHGATGEAAVVGGGGTKVFVHVAYKGTTSAVHCATSMSCKYKGGCGVITRDPQ
jgi:hypothetical protein